MALYETVMVKGYQSSVDPDTEVDVNTAMIAAGRLQSLIDSRSDQPDMAEVIAKNEPRVIAAVRSTVPMSLWPELLRKIDDNDESDDHAVDVSEEMDCAEDDEFDPSEVEFEDDGDF